MNSNWQSRCLSGNPVNSFLVSLGKEQQIMPWTQEMESNYPEACVKLVHQEIAVAFGLPQSAVLTITYIDKTGNEAAFPLYVARLSL
jgi:hypothetical protein